MRTLATRRSAGVIAFLSIVALIGLVAWPAGAVDQFNDEWPSVACGGEWHWVHVQTEATEGTLTAVFAEAGTIRIANDESPSTNLHYTIVLEGGDTLLSAGDDVEGGKLLLSHWPMCQTTTSSSTSSTTSSTSSTTSSTSSTTSSTSSTTSSTSSTTSSTTSTTTTSTTTTSTTVPRLGAIGDFVWLDADGDGRQEAGEAGIAGVQVRLYTSSDDLLGETVTDASGFYLFDGLEPGSYVVVFTLPEIPGAGVVSFTERDGGPDDLDSDAGPDGSTVAIGLSRGEVDLTWDAGVIIAEVLAETAADTLPYTGSTATDAGMLGMAILAVGALMVACSSGQAAGRGTAGDTVMGRWSTR